jgi:poly-gamma-glutamate synthesis protein (capsule biosynthesis protein)
LVELGVDVVIGNHPHNVQPIERHGYRDPSTGKRKEGLILYALGDLLSIHRTLPNSRLASLARIRISKGKAAGVESVRATSLELLPVYLYVRKTKGTCTEYRVLDFRKLAGELRSGIDRLRLGRLKAREIFRLETMMHRVLGPALR